MMTMQTAPQYEAPEVSLQAIFAEEAGAHLARIDACLGAPGQAVGAPQVSALLDTLHTLQGAARSVGLRDLEYLCHGLEGALMVCGPALSPAQLELMRQAAGVARLLAGQPSGRDRNQALALGRQLNAMAGSARHA